MANSTADGSVVIDVNMDVSDAEKELARLKSSIIKMETYLKVKGKEKGILQEQLKEANKQLEEIQSKTKVFGDYFKIDPESISKISEIKEFISATEAEIKKIDETVSKTNTKLEATKTVYGEIAQEAEKAQKAQSKKTGGKALDALKGVLSKILGLFKSIGSASLSAFKTVASASLSAFKTVASAIGSAAKKTLSLVQNLNVFSKLSGSIGHSFSRLGGMIKRVFVFSVITSGLRAIRSQISETLSSNAELSSSLSSLKGALLTAFQPIYSAILPALTTLVNTLTSVISVIAQFIAALFGTTAKQAQNNAKALNKQAGATKAAGNAAEKAEKQLAPFDEINKLSSTDGGDGGGAGGGAGEDLFGIDMDDTMFKSWGEAFDAFVDHILNEGIPKLREGLGHFADWLNLFSENLYEMFTFPGVKEKVIQIGEELALSINDFVNRVDWNQLGMALGAGLNLALLLMSNFLYEFDWLNLGSSLSSFVNGLVSEIDWYEFGRLLWAGFKIRIETLAGFLQELDTTKIIAAAQRIAKGFVDSINETFSSVDWNAIGEKLAGLFNAVLMFLFTAITTFEWTKIAADLTTLINSFLNNVNWNLLGKAVSDLFNSVLLFLFSAITTFDWAGAASSLTSAINAFIGNTNWELLGQTIAALFNSVLLFLFTAITTFQWANAAASLTSSINSFIADTNWELLGQTVAALFVGVLTFIFTAIGTFDWAGAIVSLFTSISAFINGVDWVDLAQTMSANTISALQGIAHGIQNVNWFQFVSDLYTAIKNWFTNVDWAGLTSAMAELIGSMFGAAASAVAALLGNLFSDMWNAIKNNFTENGKFTWEGFKTGLLNAIIGIPTWIYNNLFLPFINGFKKTFGIASPSTVMEQMGKYMLDGLFNGLSKIGSRVSSFGNSLLNGIKSFFGIHSPSTEFESLGDYMMMGLQNGVTEQSEPVVAAFSVLFTAVTALCTKNTELMRLSIAALLTYFMTQFAVEWEKGWYTCYVSTSSNVVLIIYSLNSIISKLLEVMSSLDAFSRKMQDTVAASIANLKKLEEQLITVIALMQMLGGLSGSKSSVSASSAQPRIATMPALAQADIPRLARGAVIPPNREFMAVLGDQKSGTNIETPLPLMIEAFKQALAQSGVGNSGTHTTILEVDRRELGRVVYQVNNEETQRIGVSFAGVNGF